MHRLPSTVKRNRTRHDIDKAGIQPRMQKDMGMLGMKDICLKDTKNQIISMPAHILANNYTGLMELHGTSKWTDGQKIASLFLTSVILMELKSGCTSNR